MHAFNHFRTLILVALLVAGGGKVVEVNAQPGLTVSFQAFYNDLAPYGRWISHPQYGSVWAPSVGPDFQPYATNGRWIVTEYGNTWASDYPWGWAPFHYGRWFFDDYDGWVWVPDYEWGPAWVSWRSGGGYYGWAPLGPGLSVRLSVTLPFNYWVFVPQVYITSPRLFSYCVPRGRVVNVYHQTTIINNYYRNNNREYAYGPRRNDIERVTRQRVDVYRSNEVSRERYQSGQYSVRDRSATGYEQPGSGRGDRDRSSSRSDYNSRSDISRSDSYDGNRGRDSYRGRTEARPDYNNRTDGNRSDSYESNNRGGDSYRGHTEPSERGTYDRSAPVDRPSRRVESTDGFRGNSSRERNSSEGVIQTPDNSRRDYSLPERGSRQESERSARPSYSEPSSPRENRSYQRSEAPAAREGRSVQRSESGGNYSRPSRSEDRGERQGRGGR